MDGSGCAWDSDRTLERQWCDLEHQQALAFSKCAGGAGPGAGYDRASDPWVTYAGSGIMYASALAFSATGFEASGGLSAVLVSRSNDSGATWGTPVAVKTDT